MQMCILCYKKKKKKSKMMIKRQSFDWTLCSRNILQRSLMTVRYLRPYGQVLTTDISQSSNINTCDTCYDTCYVTI